MHIHVRRIIHQFAKGTEERMMAVGMIPPASSAVPDRRGCWSRRLLFQSHSRFCFCKIRIIFRVCLCGGCKMKNSPMQNYSPLLLGAGVSPFAYWLGLTLKYFLKTSQKISHRRNRFFLLLQSRNIFPSFKARQHVSNGYSGNEICRCLAG